MKKLLLIHIFSILFISSLLCSDKKYTTYVELKLSAFSRYNNSEINTLVEKAKTDCTPWGHPQAIEKDLDRSFICVRAYEEWLLQKASLLLLKKDIPEAKDAESNITLITTALAHHKPVQNCTTKEEYVAAHTTMTTAFKALWKSSPKRSEIAEIAHDILYGDCFE